MQSYEAPSALISPVAWLNEITIAKVNADDNPELVLRYGVQSIPTLLVFSNGNLSKRVIGARGKAQLLQELDEFLISVP